MALISQLYPTADVYSRLLPQQGDDEQHHEKVKPVRRRRKKNKGGGDGDGDGSGSSTSGWPKKRKLSDEQVRMLELSFGNEHKLESDRKDKLAGELGLDPRQVAVWFQNRRARWKNKKMEEEYSKLKSSHDNITLDKCRLESEVLKLKEQLLEAEKEIQRLSSTERPDVAVSSNSPSSSMTMEAMEYPSSSPAFLGGGESSMFGMVESYEDVFYNMAPEATYVGNVMDWIYM